jgi:hypothetical protein
MTWFDRKHAFVEEADALADDVEAEFEGIAEALNSFVQAGRVQAAKALKPMSSSYQDIQGTSKTLVLERASIVQITAVFDVTVYEGDSFTGTINVDGSADVETATFVAPDSIATGHIRLPVTQTWCKELSAGSHAIKLVAKRNGSDTYIFDATNTGYTYLVLPDPEP